MGYTNSPLVNYTCKSPNHSGTRTHKIDRITPHCVVGQCTVETLGNVFTPCEKKASCNYGIGSDGRVLLCVDEANRSWCTSSSANDQRAITIECASDAKEPYAFKEVVYDKLVTLCADICKRNGKTKLLWIEDKTKALAYEPKADEMLLTVHRWFANKSCPGNWMYARMGDLADKVNAILTKEVKTVDKEVIERNGVTVYRTYDSIPDYAKPIVKSLMDKKVLQGTGEKVNGKVCIDLTNDLVRTLVILNRAGILK